MEQPPKKLLIVDSGDEISRLGPSFGCYANSFNTWLVIKKEFRAEADHLFGDMEVRITSEGGPHLDAPLEAQTMCHNTCPRRFSNGERS